MTDKEKKECTGKKSPWRFVFLAAALYGLWKLLSKVAARVMYLFLKDPFLLSYEAASIGIIGGADGPTAIFVTSPGWVHWLVPFLFLAVGLLGFLGLSKCRK